MIYINDIYYILNTSLSTSGGNSHSADMALTDMVYPALTTIKISSKIETDN